MRLLFCRILCALSCLPEAWAQENQPATRRLPDEIIAGKKEGTYFTGVPALAFSPDSGFIYGAVLFNFDNGSRDDPRFSYTPYLRKTMLLAVQSTKGLNQVKTESDFPSAMHSPHRIKAHLYYTRNISEQYFGVRGMNDLALPDDLEARHQASEPDDFSAYEKELRRERADGTTWARYDQYILKQTEAGLADEIQVLIPELAIRAGFSTVSTGVTDYTGQTVDAIDPDNDKQETRATMSKTRLRQDEDAGLLTGYDGGTTNALEAGVIYDSRDFEPDPSHGIYGALTAESAREELGSSTTFARYKANLRHFSSPLPDTTIGAQATYTWIEGDAPFYELPGLGGRDSLKGYRLNRFKSRAAANANWELRWRAVRTGGGGQRFVITPLLYGDYGRVFDAAPRMSSTAWRRGLGTGARIIWNQATVIGIERALQGEEEALYVNINHIF